MPSSDILQLLDIGEKVFAALLLEAEQILRNIDMSVREEFSNSIEKRRKHLVEIQNIESCLAEICLNRRGCLSSAELRTLNSFRMFREKTIRKIIEIDSLTIYLAGKKMKSFKEEMGLLVRGKTALTGYYGNKGSFRSEISDVA